MTEPPGSALLPIGLVIRTCIAGACISGACVNNSPVVDAGENGDSGVGTVLGCDPALVPDTCSTGGEACMPDYTYRSTTGFLCQPPGAFYDCIPEVGCAATNLRCVDAGAPNPWICLQPCTATADCIDPLTVCGPLQRGGASFCLINECTDLWGSCSALSGDGGDGTCVFLEVDPALGPIGACLQAGTTPLNAGCAYYRGAEPACANGTVCMPSNGEKLTGACMALCDPTTDGGPICQGTCLNAFPPAPPPPISALDFVNQGGACANACNSSGECQPGFTCYRIPSTNQLVCLP